MICPSCKNDIADGLKFCPRCGAPQGLPSQPAGMPPPPPRAGVPQPPPQQQQPPQTQPRPRRTIQRIQRDTSHDLTPASPREEPVFDPEKRKNNITIFAVAGAIAVIIAGAATYLLKPILFPPPAPKPSAAEPAALPHEPAPKQPPKQPVPAAAAKPLDESTLNDTQLQVADRMNKYFDNEIKQNYVRVYEMMTPKMRKWIAGYFIAQSADSASSYFDLRKTADEEPIVTSAALLGDIFIKGPRAEATAELTGTLGGKEFKWRFVYVLINKDDIWSIDGMSGGPQGPIRSTAAADLDGDTESETVIFMGDLLHNKMRWEAVDTDGRQVYVIEQSAFANCDPGDDEATRKAFLTATDKQPELRPMTPADEMYFKTSFPQWADARGIADAILDKRKGFMIGDACGSDKFFVLYVNGLNYVEVPQK